MGDLRLFTAVDVTDEIRSNAARLQERLNKTLGGVKWTAEEKLHLTLKFLGDVPEQNVPSVKEILRQTAAAIPSFQLEARGLGQFPEEGPPRIIWVGFQEPGTDYLKESYQLLDERYTELGVDRDSRDFHPHLTIGRVKDRGELGDYRDVLSGEQGLVLGKMTVEEITLYKSELHPEGSKYTVLEKAELGTNS